MGKIFNDANDKNVAVRVIYANDNKKLFYDSKTILQEITQGKHMGDISYELISEEGPDHNKIFNVALKIGDKIVEKGCGKTKKAAEQEAAYKTILKLRAGK